MGGTRALTWRESLAGLIRYAHRRSRAIRSHGAHGQVTPRPTILQGQACAQTCSRCTQKDTRTSDVTCLLRVCLQLTLLRVCLQPRLPPRDLLRGGARQLTLLTRITTESLSFCCFAFAAKACFAAMVFGAQAWCKRVVAPES